MRLNNSSLTRLLVPALSCLIFGQSIARSVENLTLDDALTQALQSNPEISAAASRAEASRAEIGLARSLPDPKIGLMRENNLTTEQEMMGPMNSWSISQEIMFPAKYSLMGKAKRAAADAATHRVAEAKLSVRQKVISAYAGLYSARQILALLEAQRETLREISRIAESRRATGAVPQQDEMKSHVEQTKIETEILMQKQEIDEMEGMLNGLLKRAPNEPISIASGSLKPPTLKEKSNEIERLALTNSKAIASGRSMLEEAEKMKSLAKFSYAPNFMVSLRKPFSNAPSDAYAVSLDMTIPLWFFSRQSSEVSSATAQAAAAQADLDGMVYETRGEIKGLTSKVETFEKMMKVYESALIPQATSTLSSSRSAYSAGRAEFMDLLDAERMLYEVRIGYYRALTNYIESIVQLEKVAGVSLSTLPFGEGH